MAASIRKLGQHLRERQLEHVQEVALQLGDRQPGHAFHPDGVDSPSPSAQARGLLQGVPRSILWWENMP